MLTSLFAKGWRRVMLVTVGVFLSARATMPVMKAQGSAAILRTACDGNPPMPHDVTRRATALRLKRSMARELGPHGRVVNIPAPRCTLSEGMLANATQPRRGRQENIGEAPVKRDKIQNNVMTAALLLCGPEASFITSRTPVLSAKVILH